MPARKNTFKSYLPVVLMLAIMFMLLHSMTNAISQSENLSRYFVLLLILTLIGLTVMLVMIGWHLIRLLVQLKKKRPGARLTARLFIIFSVLSLAPVSILYYYSIHFILSGVDSWFDVKIDNAMTDAIKLSQASLNLQKKSKRIITRQILNNLTDSSKAGIALTLSQAREEINANELTLFDVDGRVIATANADPLTIVPNSPKLNILQQVKDGMDYINLETSEKIADSEENKAELQHQKKVSLRIVILDQRDRPYILQAIFPTSANIAKLSLRLENALVRYKKLSYLRSPLKKIFLLTLFLVLLFSAFTALWIAFVFSRRLIDPLSAIAEGTSAVAEGDFSHQLTPISGRNEISFLVHSFNLMTRRLSRAKRETEISRKMLESQTAYLQTVLAELSTGVITFNAGLQITTINVAAEKILKMALKPFLAWSVDDIQQQPLKTLLNEINPFFQNPKINHWHGEIKLQRDERLQILNVSISDLGSNDKENQGFVLVFDDVSGLISAQRDAAWGEVARRLAHEIKNPLTPIQLSAERLRHKYLKTMNEEDGKVLIKATNTIVQQVEAMKAMVNEFSDYAKPSKINPKPILIDQFIADILELYSHTENIQIILSFNAEYAYIEADALRLRQVIHNLIKNAQEAIKAKEIKEGKIEVKTRIIEEQDQFFVEFSVADNGTGFDTECQGHIFEPYVTTKSKGTGLGLAIVNKIIEEHRGKIWGENRPDGGAIMTLRLPLSSNDSFLHLLADKSGT